MTELRFYGGVGEIGGNKFLLEDGSSRVFLDFGKNFAREKRFFDEPWISPRNEDHLVGLGILPRLDGLYQRDVDHGPSVDAVLISHPHMDHYDAIRWLKKEIPAYSSVAARSIILAREFSGRSGPSKEYNIAHRTVKEGRQVHRPLKTLPSGKPTDIGGVTTTLYDVDHSVPGAAGYLVETNEGIVAYTGDFRLHGPGGEKSRTFLEAAREREPAALLIEGTNVDECKVESEAEVREKVTSLARGTDGLVVAGFAIADLDRLTTFYHVAHDTDRTLIITTKQAFLLNSLVEAGQFDAFTPAADEILILKKPRKTIYWWEKELFEKYGPHVVEVSDVRGMQEEAILVASLMDMHALPVIEPMAGSIYVLSSSEPFDEEGEISHEKLMGWLTYYGLPLFHVHASGHASAQELRTAVETVQAKKVYLIHTANPELYARFLGKLGHEVVQPIEGKQYHL